MDRLEGSVSIVQVNEEQSVWQALEIERDFKIQGKTIKQKIQSSIEATKLRISLQRRRRKKKLLRSKAEAVFIDQDYGICTLIKKLKR